MYNRNININRDSALIAFDPVALRTPISFDG